MKDDDGFGLVVALGILVLLIVALGLAWGKF